MLALTSSHVIHITHHTPHSPLWARVTVVWVSQANMRIQTKGWHNFTAQAAQWHKPSLNVQSQRPPRMSCWCRRWGWLGLIGGPMGIMQLLLWLERSHKQALRYRTVHWTEGPCTSSNAIDNHRTVRTVCGHCGCAAVCGIGRLQQTSKLRTGCIRCAEGSARW